MTKNNANLNIYHYLQGGGGGGTNGMFTTRVDHMLLPMFTQPPLASDPEKIPVLDRHQIVKLHTLFKIPDPNKPYPV